MGFLLGVYQMVDLPFFIFQVFLSDMCRKHSVAEFAHTIQNPDVFILLSVILLYVTSFFYETMRLTVSMWDYPLEAL